MVISFEEWLYANLVFFSEEKDKKLSKVSNALESLMTSPCVVVKRLLHRIKQIDIKFCIRWLLIFFLNRVLPYLILVLLINVVQDIFYAPKKEYPFRRVDNHTRLDLAFRFRQSQYHELCETNTTLFIGIISRPSEFDLRAKVRDSWAKRGVAYDRNFTRVEFFVGAPQIWEERRLQEEMFNFRDLSIISMEEDYYALPQKTLALLMYKEQKCPKARCLIKSDSDNVLNVPLFEKLCNETTGGERRIYGGCSVKRKVQRHGKWAIPKWLIPEPEFPQYCSTGIYMMTGNRTVNHLLHEVSVSEYTRSANYRKLPEDVLFSGIFPDRAGIPRITLQGLSFNSSIVSECFNQTTRIYSLHMTKNKNPQEHFEKIREANNVTCETR